MTYLLRVAPAVLAFSVLASSPCEGWGQDPDTVRQTLPRYTAAQIDSLVAPVALGDDVYVAAGSTVTRDVEKGALVFNDKPQRVRAGWVAGFRKKAGETEES